MFDVFINNLIFNKTYTKINIRIRFIIFVSNIFTSTTDAYSWTNFNIIDGRKLESC